MHKTLIANLTMRYADILVICSGPICSNRKQLLTLMRGFGLYFHKNLSEKAMEHSNPDANDLDLLNDVMQAVTFQQM